MANNPSYANHVRIRRHAGFSFQGVNLAMGLLLLMIIGCGLFYIRFFEAASGAIFMVLNEQTQLQNQESGLQVRLPEDQEAILADCGRGPILVSDKHAKPTPSSDDSGIYEVTFHARRAGCGNLASVTIGYHVPMTLDQAEYSYLSRVVAVAPGLHAN